MNTTIDYPEAIKQIRNPDWPNGIDAKMMLDHYAFDALGCHWCGRETRAAHTGHDGFCPIPFLDKALLVIRDLDTALKNV